MLKLSVILTVYNAEQYIKESLDSLLHQTFKDFEIIIVNDGSNDDTRNIIFEYMDKFDGVVRLLENQYNEGIPVSRNRALLAAQGEYIAIHDADDISLNNRFADEVSFLDNHPEIVFMGGHAIKISLTGEHIGSLSYPPKDTPSAFFILNKYKLNPIIDPSCMYRRNTILQCGGYSMNANIITVPDLDLWCRLLTKGYLMSNIQEPLIKYRINPMGVTRRQHNEMVQATDAVWSSFRRKSLEDPILRQDCFKQDFYTEYLNIL